MLPLKSWFYEIRECFSSVFAECEEKLWHVNQLLQAQIITKKRANCIYCKLKQHY